MNNGFTAIVLVLSAGLLGAAGQQGGSKVELKNAQGQSVGTVTLSPARSGGVNMALDLKNLPPDGTRSISTSQQSARRRLSSLPVPTSTLKPRNTVCSIRKGRMLAT